MPVQEDIAKAYQHYYTHWDSTIGRPGHGFIRRFIRSVKASYLDYTYGYGRSGPKSWLGLLAHLTPCQRAELDFSVMYLRFLQAGRLLEVGCGSGTMLKGMANLGWRAEGIDSDPRAAENCRRRGLNVRAGFLEDLQYPANYYDVVTMSHLIEHVHEPLELLIECHRILKPSGRLSLVTPNINSAGHRVYGSSWFHLDPPRHLHIFSVASLKALLQKAGFRSMKIRTTIRDAAGAYVGSRSIGRTGRFEFGSRQPRSARLWGRAMTAVEWAWLKLDDQVGEEIAVVAQKEKKHSE
ncbi:MAG: class I SAM-dependent methyltransferase [Acidobacteriia bacterium]|nr:class I SAM-dependent methyltransferase [Terriglobia bacterium]